MAKCSELMRECDSSTDSDEDSDEEDSEPLVDFFELEEDIGSKLNEWIFPVNEWGENDSGWKRHMKERLGKVNFSKRRWNVSCSVANFVLEKLIKRSRAVVIMDDLRLELKKYIYQGSSREGLKVKKPDECDTIMIFEIEDLSIRVKQFKDGHMLIPEVGKVIVENITMKKLKRNYQALYDKDVFYEDDDNEICIDASNLIDVFESIFEKAIKKIKHGIRIGRKTKIDNIWLEVNNPSINLDIGYSYKDHGREVNIDVVPAFVVKYDEIKLPWYFKRESVKCPVYAVLKWIEIRDPVWRICYSGYEKHIIDEARNVIKGQMILTAFRLMKTFNKRNIDKPTYFEHDSVVSSYQLKNIMFYVLVWLLEKHPEIEINGVQKVLPYFIVFLEESIRHHKLPHFFYSSSMSPFSKKSMRYNVLERMTSTMHDLYKFCTDIKQLIGYGNYSDDYTMATVRQEYVEEITHGTYIPWEGIEHAIRKQECVSVTRRSKVRKQCFRV